MLNEKCFACDKPIYKTTPKQVSVLNEETVVYVGQDCFAKIKNAGKDGFQPKKGGPRLIVLASDNC